VRLTRGKQGFAEFCESAYEFGATRILLVGAFHGNPGRIGFLDYSKDGWDFYPPTIIITSAQLLRERSQNSPRKIKKLVVIPDLPNDQSKAQLLAQALNVPCIERDTLSDFHSEVAVLRVALAQYKAMDFVSPDESQPLGPAMRVKHFLTRPIGEQKRW
jgi:rRNA maturation protein Rpf1